MDLIKTLGVVAFAIVLGACKREETAETLPQDPYRDLVESGDWKRDKAVEMIRSRSMISPREALDLLGGEPDPKFAGAMRTEILIGWANDDVRGVMDWLRQNPDAEGTGARGIELPEVIYVKAAESALEGGEWEEAVSFLREMPTSGYAQDWGGALEVVLDRARAERALDLVAGEYRENSDWHPVLQAGIEAALGNGQEAVVILESMEEEADRIAAVRLIGRQWVTGDIDATETTALAESLLTKSRLGDQSLETVCGGLQSVRTGSMLYDWLARMEPSKERDREILKLATRRALQNRDQAVAWVQELQDGDLREEVKLFLNRFQN